MDKSLFKTYQFTAQIERFEGKGGWYYVSIPKKLYLEIKKNFSHLSHSCGTIGLQAQVSSMKWKTAIFYHRKFSSYFLPIKANVRKKLNLEIDGEIKVKLFFEK